MKHRCFGCWCLEDESTAKYAKRIKKEDTRFFCKACCKKIKNGEEVKNTVCKKKEKIPEQVKFVPFEETDEYKSQVQEGRNYRKMMQGRLNE